MSKRPATQTRLTKAERKEQARRERVELQRKMARAKRNRRIAIVVVGVLIVGAVAFAFTQRESTAIADPQDLLAQAEQASATAGCTEAENVGPYQPDSQDQAHVPPAEVPPLSRYTSQPPASGPHNQVPLGAGVYSSPPPVDRLLHSMEHGGVVVWYAPEVEGTPELDRLLAFYEGNGEAGGRVIVAPYDYPDDGEAGQLPSGSRMAVTAWHTVQTCTDVNLAAAFGFTSRFAFPPFGEQEYEGEAPEPGAAM